MSVDGGGEHCGQSRFGVRAISRAHFAPLSFGCLLDTQAEVLARHESNIWGGGLS